MASPRANQATVLVADGDPDLRQALRYLLEEDGYDVLEAADGVATLDLLRSDPRRLVVLLDHDLRKLDGVSLLRHIAHDRQLRQRHAFVFMTLNRLTSRLATLRFLSMLQVPLIRKPFDIEQVEEAVAKATAALHVSVR